MKRLGIAIAVALALSGSAVAEPPDDQPIFSRATLESSSPKALAKLLLVGDPLADDVTTAVFTEGSSQPSTGRTLILLPNVHFTAPSVQVAEGICRFRNTAIYFEHVDGGFQLRPMPSSSIPA